MASAFTLCLFCLAPLVWQPDDSNMPFIRFTRSSGVVNVGVSAVGQTKAHTIVIVNDLKEVVTMQSVEASCGCVGVEFPVRRLLPGQHFPLELTWRLRSSPGTEGVDVTVIGSIGEEVKRGTIALVSNVRPVVKIGKGTESTDVRVAENVVEQRLDLPILRMKHPLEFDTIFAEMDNRFGHATVHETEDGWRLALSFPISKLAGNLSVPLSIPFLKNGSPLNYQVRHDIRMFIPSHVTASHDALLIGSLRPGEQRIRQVVVRAEDNVAISKVTVVDPRVHLVCITHDGTSATVTLQFGTVGSAGRFEGAIIIECMERESKIFRIEYLGFELPP